MPKLDPMLIRQFKGVRLAVFCLLEGADRPMVAQDIAYKCGYSLKSVVKAAREMHERGFLQVSLAGWSLNPMAGTQHIAIQKGEPLPSQPSPAKPSTMLTECVRQIDEIRRSLTQQQQALAALATAISLWVGEEPGNNFSSKEKKVLLDGNYFQRSRKWGKNFQPKKQKKSQDLKIFKDKKDFKDLKIQDHDFEFKDLEELMLISGKNFLAERHTPEPHPQTIGEAVTQPANQPHSVPQPPATKIVEKTSNPDHAEKYSYTVAFSGKKFHMPPGMAGPPQPVQTGQGQQPKSPVEVPRQPLPAAEPKPTLPAISSEERQKLAILESSGFRDIEHIRQPALRPEVSVAFLQDLRDEFYGKRCWGPTGELYFIQLLQEEIARKTKARHAGPIAEQPTTDPIPNLWAQPRLIASRPMAP